MSENFCFRHILCFYEAYPLLFIQRGHLRMKYFLATILILLAALPGARGQSRGDQPLVAASLNRELLASLVLEETNRVRAAAGRGELMWLEPLAIAAGDHAAAMTRHGFFDHTNSFDPAQRTLGDRMARVGVRSPAIAENIAMTFSVDFTAMRDWMRRGAGKGPAPRAVQHTYRSFGRSLVQQWMDSPAHRVNILNGRMRHLGLGFATMRDSKGLDRFYCVQEFCAPERSMAMRRRLIGAL